MRFRYSILTLLPLGIALLGYPTVNTQSQKSVVVYPDAFPDSVYPHTNPEYTRDDLHPEQKYNGATFKLSQNYPKNDTFSLKDYPWLCVDFRKHFADYMREVLRSAYQANLSTDWHPERSGNRWFHAPWMHYKQDHSYQDEKGNHIFLGREFIHGLTLELPSQPYALSPKQSTTRQNWAVSLYNAPGGVTLGKVWHKIQQGGISSVKRQDCLFPKGTVAIKLLFTEATAEDLASLKGSPSWDAHIFLPTNDKPAKRQPPYLLKQISVRGQSISVYKRSIRKLNLLQIDIAVRDDRSPIGWVFGTFVYMAPPSGTHRHFTQAAKGANIAWDDVVPIGIAWGNDPNILPGSNTVLQEQRRTSGAPLYMGWGGRLNGPLDNSQSSCVSCHSTGATSHIPRFAFDPKIASAPSPYNNASLPPYLNVPEGGIPPQVRTVATKLYFRRLHRGESFWRGLTTTDFSLQLSEGMRNYSEALGNALK